MGGDVSSYPSQAHPWGMTFSKFFVSSKLDGWSFV